MAPPIILFLHTVAMEIVQLRCTLIAKLSLGTDFHGTQSTVEILHTQHQSLNIASLLSKYFSLSCYIICWF